MIVLLRISLAVVFVWFGALKVAGYNPVYDIVAASFPMFVTPTGNVLLGAIETIIGIALLFNIAPWVTHIALIAHLAGTFSVFAFAPGLMFDPFFPILSLSGEFVFKNIVLAMAGLVVLTHAHGKKLSTVASARHRAGAILK